MSGEKVPAIGIDIGASYSRVGMYNCGNVEVIANKQGKRSIPSCVAFTDSGILVGDEAVNQFAVNSSNTVYGAKCLLDKHPLQAYQKYCPFTIVSANNRTEIQVTYKGQTRTFLPEEIIAIILLKLKHTAEEYLNSKVNQAVISVPSGFDSFQRQAIRDAASIAGLHVLRLLNESSAAAIIYGCNCKSLSEVNALIVDMGASSLDVSVVGVRESVFKVKSYASDLQLGGADFDELLIDYCVRDFERQRKKDLRRDRLGMQRLRAACEDAKRKKLSSTVIKLQDEGFDCFVQISEAKFEELCADLFRRVLETIKTALREAGLETRQIGDVVLTGGSAKMPQIKSLLSRWFEREILRDFDDNSVVAGTAIEAARLSGDSSCQVRGMFFFDVVTRSLGIETNGGGMRRIVKRNTSIPARVSQVVSVGDVNRIDEGLLIRVYEGESVEVRNNDFLGSLVLGWITAKRAQIEVIFDIDANGDLTVSAVDLSIKNKQETKVVGRAGLGRERIERSRREFERDVATQREELDRMVRDFSGQKLV